MYPTEGAPAVVAAARREVGTSTSARPTTILSFLLASTVASRVDGDSDSLHSLLSPSSTQALL